MLTDSQAAVTELEIMIATEIIRAYGYPGDAVHPIFWNVGLECDEQETSEFLARIREGGAIFAAAYLLSLGGRLKRRPKNPLETD